MLHTLIIRNNYCFSTAAVVTLTRLIVTLYVHCLPGSLLCVSILLSVVTVLWRKLVGWMCASSQKTGIK